MRYFATTMPNRPAASQWLLFLGRHFASRFVFNKYVFCVLLFGNVARLLLNIECFFRLGFLDSSAEEKLFAVERGRSRETFSICLESRGL
jgi:hypothetical protein